MYSSLLSEIYNKGKGFLENREELTFEEVTSKKFKKVLYHGSSDPDIKKFDLSKIGKNADRGWFSQGIYFTEAKALTTYYGKYAYKCLVTLKKAYITNLQNSKESGDAQIFRDELGLSLKAKSKDITKHLKGKGYDGVVILDSHNSKFVKECIVYNPKDIEILEREGQ